MLVLDYINKIITKCIISSSKCWYILPISTKSSSVCVKLTLLDSILESAPIFLLIY